MSYLTVSEIRQDPIIRDRVSACIAVEGINSNRPEDWATEHAWQLAAQPGWSAAWESAQASHTEEGYEPGKDPSVITDAMILSAVQAIRSVEEGGTE